MDSSSRTPKATSSAASDRRLGPCLIARLTTGLILGCFGFWELTGPSQWTGYVPQFLANIASPLLLVVLHGWILFLLGAAALIDFAPVVTAWSAVVVVAEVAGGLALTSGFTEILVRDVGLLALALVWALESRHQRDASAANELGTA